MSQTVTLGGDRLGSGKKQTVELHNYEMTSFNQSRDFKSTIAPGVLVPFLKEVATNHGTFDIDLDTFVRTLPTVGPLYGTFKMQADIFAVPMRLYQGLLHNNPVTLGMKMNQVYLPKLRFSTIDGETAPRVKGSNDDDFQVNTSALLKYLGISGAGRKASQGSNGIISRKFQCVPMLAYYDIFKCYYANKQEEDAYVITPGTVVEAEAEGIYMTIPSLNLEIVNDSGQDATDISTFTTNENAGLQINIKGKNLNPENIILNLYYGEEYSEVGDNLKAMNDNGDGKIINATDEEINFTLYVNKIIEPTRREGNLTIGYETESPARAEYTADIHLQPFKLANIDDMRNALLSANTIGKEFVLGDAEGDDWTSTSGTDNTGLPYSALFKCTSEDITWNAFIQNGLVVKTYQSDLFNNWLDTEYIDGENGISAISSVAVVNNKFTMDSLNLAEKVYEYLNRVLVSGGTYEDWQEATYGQGAVRKAETPMYVGGMSTEIYFEEVIATTENESADQPLGSLGGKGTVPRDAKGHAIINGGKNIHIKCEEPSYIIGIMSITPRICYSQGNDWDMTELDTMDDLHKPALDGIGFQDLMVEQMAWWNASLDGSTLLGRSSAGKQIAWINYQTAIDKCYGDFAKTGKDSLAFMVLNRNYEHDGTVTGVKDITTYIDPAKYNYAFAYTKLDAQNFWVQIHTYMTSRRKMAGKQIPNL